MGGSGLESARRDLERRFFEGFEDRFELEPTDTMSFEQLSHGLRLELVIEEQHEQLAEKSVQGPATRSQFH